MNCSNDRIHSYSLGAYADEKINIHYPQDGVYWVLVHGNQVPGGTQTFDVKIRVAQGASLSLRNAPIGPIRAGVPVSVDIGYQMYYPKDAPAELEGILFVGPPAAPDALEIPIHLQPDILLYPQPRLTAFSRWISQTPVPVTLSFQNIGVTAENVEVQIVLPEGLVYQPGSSGGSAPLAVYDPLTHTLTWNGTAQGGEEIILSFLATAEPDDPPGSVSITARVKGLISGQEWEVSSQIELNRFGIFMPLIRR